MKKIAKVFLSFLLVFICIAPITCFATEIAEQGGEVSYHTIFTRLWEFVEANKTEVVSGVGSALVLIANAAIKASNTKGNNKLSESLEVIQGTASNTTKAQGSIVNAVNQMITGANAMTEKVETMYAAYEENQALENERNRLLGAMMVEVTAILEMLSSVYVHNGHLPQGVKDLVVLKYANTQKALSDDELLYAIVEAVRGKINFNESTELPSDEVSEAEAVM